jgi:hypothetical protein
VELRGEAWAHDEVGFLRLADEARDDGFAVWVIEEIGEEGWPRRGRRIVQEYFARKAEAFFKNPGPLQENPRQEEVVSAQDYIPEDVADDATLVPKREARAEESKRSNALVVVPQALPRAPVADGFEAALAWMNEHHAIIDNVGGKSLIAGREKSDRGRDVVVFQTKDSFLLRYSNQTIPWRHPTGEMVGVSLGKWWLNHERRAQHRGVTFLPGRQEKVVDECLNIWRGWGIEPSPGDWNLIRQHIEQVIADGNKEFAEYVIRWIAWAIQHPAEMAEVALVLIGPKGTGKGTLVRCLERIFGSHTFQVTSQEEVIGKFNSHLQDCILFVADEAYWGGHKKCVGRLQGMITEPWLPIERKGIDLIQARNCLHVIMLAEPGWVIPAGRYERRYAALAVNTKHQGDKPYFRALHRQIGEGGAAAMFWDLRAMELGDWHPRDIPERLLKNPALQKQQKLTLPPLEQWYLLLLHEGRMPGPALTKRPCYAPTRTLVDDARERIPALKWTLSDVELGTFLTDMERIGVVCTKHRTSAANGWDFPPLAECRAAWEKRYGPTDWERPVEEWGQKL